MVYLADVGLQVFLFFQDEEEVVVGMESLVNLADVGMQVFHDKENEVGMERLVDVGIEVEEVVVVNHVRKEHVPYFVNYKESTP
jgi:hypothetical protein